MSDTDRGTDRAGRPKKRFLSPSQKYDWLQTSPAGSDDRRRGVAEHVDRSTIMRIRTVAKEGALAALAASKPGVVANQRDYELELAKAENARLGQALNLPCATYHQQRSRPAQVGPEVRRCRPSHCMDILRPSLGSGERAQRIWGSPVELQWRPAGATVERLARSMGSKLRG